MDRNRIMKLFETLSARLAARGIRGQLYIVGGSTMIVDYGSGQHVTSTTVRSLARRLGQMSEARRKRPMKQTAEDGVLEPALAR